MTIMATSGNKGFWRKNSSAIPGRINLQRKSSSENNADESTSNPSKITTTSSSIVSSSVSCSENMPHHSQNRAATSFKDFEKSVSDAWDIRDLENASVTRPAEMVEIAISHQPSKPTPQFNGKRVVAKI